MLATENTILNFIPQRPPIVMVHRLLEASETHAVSQLLVENTNVFFREGELKEPGLIENLAQTAAAQVGYQCSLKNIPVPIGFIASIRKLNIHFLPKEGEWLTTTIRVTNHVLDVTVIEGDVECRGEVCLRCEMRIFVKNHAS